MVPLQHNVSSCLSQAEIRDIGYHGKESREGHQGHQGDTNGKTPPVHNTQTQTIYCGSKSYGPFRIPASIANHGRCREEVG